MHAEIILTPSRHIERVLKYVDIIFLQSILNAYLREVHLSILNILDSHSPHFTITNLTFHFSIAHKIDATENNHKRLPTLCG